MLYFMVLEQSLRLSGCGRASWHSHKIPSPSLDSDKIDWLLNIF